MGAKEAAGKQAQRGPCLIPASAARLSVSGPRCPGPSRGAPQGDHLSSTSVKPGQVTAFRGLPRFPHRPVGNPHVCMGPGSSMTQRESLPFRGLTAASVYPDVTDCLGLDSPSGQQIFTQHLLSPGGLRRREGLGRTAQALPCVWGLRQGGPSAGPQCFPNVGGQGRADLNITITVSLGHQGGAW